ncbi:MAG: Holliday junction resolvase RuvX, partial [Bifidobacteriaceae bacterium]|nr:Holliday junction resolvase RuvX [Bifidobacteriaceae bacterium]
QRAGDSPAALARRIAAEAAERGVTRVIVGWPINMDGSEGPRAAEARAVAEALGDQAGLVDERLTTRQAEAQLRGAGRSAKRQRPVVDQAAAVIILQAALDGVEPVNVTKR